MVIDITLGIYRAARAGEFAAISPTRAALIGRKPMSVRAVLEAAIDAYQPRAIGTVPSWSNSATTSAIRGYEPGY